METKPIALLIPVYNRQEKLERTLKSLEPELHLLDIILVDDGSTPPIDVKKLSQYPIHLIRLPQNKGIIGALNAGLEYIYTQNYEFIARLDSDDMVINQRFTKQLAFMRDHPEVGLLGSHFDVVDSKGTILSHSVRPLHDLNIRKAMHIGCVLGHVTLMMRTSVACKNGFYNPEYKAAEDYEYYWRMLAITRVENLSDRLVQCAISLTGDISKDHRLAQASTALKIKLRHFQLFNIYVYMGLIVSLLEITDTFKYTIKIRKAVMDRLFKE